MGLSICIVISRFMEIVLAEKKSRKNIFTINSNHLSVYQVIQRDDKNYGWVDLQVFVPEEIY